MPSFVRRSDPASYVPGHGAWNAAIRRTWGAPLGGDGEANDGVQATDQSCQLLGFGAKDFPVLVFDRALPIDQLLEQALCTSRDFGALHRETRAKTS